MILKHADDKLPALVRLEALVKSGRIPESKVPVVEQALRIAHAGIKGERESAYQLDFRAQDSKSTAVIHDLRLELPDGRVAQLDHLLIHHSYRFYLLETKHFTHGLKITDAGEFLRWNNWKRNFEGIPSPIEQNSRHALVLGKVIESLGLPPPTIRNFVLVSDSARVDRPKHFDSSMVVKADQFATAMQKDIDAANPLEIIGGFLKSAWKGHVEEIGNKLVALHRPVAIDYLANLGIQLLPAAQRPRPGAGVVVAIDAQSTPPVASATGARQVPAASWPGVACKECGGSDLTIHAGRYGYYFRCGPCQVNTAIRLGCGHAGHNERLRKSGTRYFRECADCDSSSLYFEAPAG